MNFASFFSRFFLVVYGALLASGTIFHFEFFPISDFRFFASDRKLDSVLLLDFFAAGDDGILRRLEGNKWFRVSRMARILGYGRKANAGPYVHQKLIGCRESFRYCVAYRKIPHLKEGKLTLETEVYDELD